MTDIQLKDFINFHFGKFLDTQTAENIYDEIIAHQSEIYKQGFLAGYEFASKQGKVIDLK